LLGGLALSLNLSAEMRGKVVGIHVDSWRLCVRQGVAFDFLCSPVPPFYLRLSRPRRYSRRG